MRYLTPQSFEDAASMASRESGIIRFLAGGTDVLVQLRADIVEPDVLIDVKHIDGVRDMTRNADGSWRIGVAVSGAEMSENAELVAEWPGIVEAMDLVGSTQIQGRATLAGNLCNASPAADSVPAMIAAGAKVEVTGPKGQRQIAVEDVPTAPGKTSLKQGELVSAVLLPPRAPRSGDAYLRFIPRTEMDIAVVGAGVNVTLEGNTISHARISLGAVAPTPLLVEYAAKALIGSTCDEAALAELAKACEAACNPINDKRGTIEFRTEIAGVMASRATKIAYARAKGDAT